MDYDYTEPDWTNPASLRAAAERLKQQAAKMAVEMDKYRRFKPEPVAGDPFADIDDTPEDPAVTEQRERDYRTWQAKREIMDALAEEERQTKQQQQRELQAFYRTDLGRLLR
jgi:hypothetical protein